MIHAKHKSEHTLRWKKEFTDSCFGADDFVKQSTDETLDQNTLQAVDSLFPIRIPYRFLEKHQRQDYAPVLKQYLPDTRELNTAKYSSENPVGDLEATLLPGVIKKYRNRVLLVTTNTCPIHCRYCFRKNYQYPTSSPNKHRFKQALDFCLQDSSIQEVILSGGDPLSLEDELLDYLFTEIQKIPHVNTIRVHTKFPSIIPSRITPDLINTLRQSKLNIVFVFHINHPLEINHDFHEAVSQIKSTGTHTLNQSVLLQGVNDQAEVLEHLSRKLFDAGVLPYYLHMLDPAIGTEHFQVSAQKAQQLMQALKKQLPGYLVPKLATEVAGEESKIY